jgi:uncharacterized membrane protein YphA (DoxX/SURF4 family)
MMAQDVQPTDQVRSSAAGSTWSAYVLLFGRICFAADFMLFGARKFANAFDHLQAARDASFARRAGLSDDGAAVRLRSLVLLGLQTRLARRALGWFCIVAPSIFWLDSLEHLSRDYAAAGGFMLLVLFGPGGSLARCAVRTARRRRFRSFRTSSPARP